MTAREDEMREMRAAGATLAAIGRRFGISRERASQILKRAGRQYRSPAHERAATLSAERGIARWQHPDVRTFHRTPYNEATWPALYQRYRAALADVDARLAAPASGEGP